MRRGDHRRHVLRLRGPLLRLKEVVTDGAADNALPVLLKEYVPRGVDEEETVDHGCGGSQLRRSETPERSLHKPRPQTPPALLPMPPPLARAAWPWQAPPPGARTNTRASTGDGSPQRALRLDEPPTPARRRPMRRAAHDAAQRRAPTPLRWNGDPGGYGITPGRAPRTACPCVPHLCPATDSVPFPSHPARVTYLTRQGATRRRPARGPQAPSYAGRSRQAAPSRLGAVPHGGSRRSSPACFSPTFRGLFARWELEYSP